MSVRKRRMTKIRFPENATIAYIEEVNPTDALALAVGIDRKHNFDQVSVDKNLYQQSFGRANRIHPNVNRALRSEVKHYQNTMCMGELSETIQGVCHCISWSETSPRVLSIDVGETENQIFDSLGRVVGRILEIPRGVVDGIETPGARIEIRTPVPKTVRCMRAVFKRNPPPPRTIISKYSGRVDVLDEDVLLVTIKGRNGNPTQLSFPIEMAKEAKLASGDFISYVIFRDHMELSHEFRKENPKLSPEEESEIDQFVDELLGDLE